MARPALVYLGAIPTVSARFEDQPELQKILGWADEIRRMGVWTNADKPEEAAQARGYGAEGIGLCRTEHMFREGERLEIVRDAILVASVATRAKTRRDAGEDLDADDVEAVDRFDASMAKLEVLQQGDFEGIFKAMDGLPVVIRLLDPPLHEFLPNLEEQLVKVTRAEATGGASEEDKELLATIKSLHEQNPMLGLRGCRLGLMFPDFVKIQTRAILNAQIAVKKAGGNPIAKIMIPLVGHANELKKTKELLEAEAKAVEGKAGVEVDYKFGTMIEVPARRPDGGRDRGGRRVLQLRHERPDPDDVRLQPRRRRRRLPPQVRRGRDPAGQPVPDARRRGRRAHEDRRRQGPRDAPRHRARDLR